VCDKETDRRQIYANVRNKFQTVESITSRDVSFRMHFLSQKCLNSRVRSALNSISEMAETSWSQSLRLLFGRRNANKDRKTDKSKRAMALLTAFAFDCKYHVNETKTNRQSKNGAANCMQFYSRMSDDDAIYSGNEEKIGQNLDTHTGPVSLMWRQ